MSSRGRCTRHYYDKAYWQGFLVSKGQILGSRPNVSGVQPAPSYLIIIRIAMRTLVQHILRHLFIIIPPALRYSRRRYRAVVSIIYRQAPRLNLHPKYLVPQGSKLRYCSFVLPSRCVICIVEQRLHQVTTSVPMGGPLIITEPMALPMQPSIAVASQRRAVRISTLQNGLTCQEALQCPARVDM